MRIAMPIEDAIRQLAQTYAKTLQSKITDRDLALQHEPTDHYLIYRVLGIPLAEGQRVDRYQNMGRFVYRYAGSLLEQATVLCFQTKFPNATSLKIANSAGQRPKTFEVDLVLGSSAYEIKWRDATTDGDHILKEHARVRAIAAAGYTPIRLMFYYPTRAQAIKIQDALQDLYRANQGLYLHSQAAWDHVYEQTGIPLYTILTAIADENVP
ncbi:MAG: ApaLI family restriction endonuclease [Phototrophicaceae bacterium]